jgi:predicted dehydrogenase
MSLLIPTLLTGKVAGMDKVRIGIIGCGGMSRHHGRVLTQQIPEAEIAAICDTQPGNIARFQREILDPAKISPPTFSDHLDMLAKVELDGVIIVTPHVHHFDQTIAALDAGCHVLLEKPMVTGVEDARQLIDYSQQKQRAISVAFPGPFSAEFAYIRHLITTGQLGQPIMLHAFVTQNWKKPTTGTWRQDPPLSGGGQAYDSGAHMFNALLYLSNQDPVEVFAWTDNRGTPVEITAVATIRFANGALAAATVGGDDVTFQEGVYLSAEKGSIRTGIYGNRLEQWDASGKQIRYPQVPDVAGMHRNFVEIIRGRAESPCPPIWGLRQALLMEAIYASARTGQPVRVNPV